jgi:type II secretory ATPase GspE/PulE/Tfp pilus assembly ATPase PilB-like protein
VHIEPYEQELVVRYRIDGVLQRANVPATINRFGAAISRLKIMANLNIAEKRRPQDGRITFKHRAPGQPPQEYDLRVSVIPMLFGEGVVLRVLSKAAVLMSLERPGHAGTCWRWDRLINRPHGILLVTGPTGSGKSTTLYASLNRIVSDEVKVITVEDPVEYHVPGVNQIQVNHKVGTSTFERPAGHPASRPGRRDDRRNPRQGDGRDRGAGVADRAPGLQHAAHQRRVRRDDALLDMGVEPFLVSSSVEGILAQRLVRRLCTFCGVDGPAVAFRGR